MDAIPNALPDIETAFRRCTEIARASGSNMWHVGRVLGTRRRRMFVASYASMRVIDDFVDDTFLRLPAAEREVARPAALARVDAWEADCVAALDRRPATGSGLEGAILTGLRTAFGQADLADFSWRELARVMRRDIREERFRVWSDFEDYCEGATVAPAAIFLYLLAARIGPDDVAENGLPAAPHDCARDIAIFCYLVHIIRDLRKDAAESALLVTIPEETLGQALLTRDDLAQGALPAAVADGRASRLISILSGHAARYRRGAEEMHERIAPLLGLRERAVFSTLLGVYRRLHDRIEKDPGLVLSEDGAAVEAIRRDALAQLVADTGEGGTDDR